MLSSIQISFCRPYTNLGIISASASSQYTLTVSPVHGPQLPLKRLRLVYNAAQRRKSSPVCFFGGKGKSENNNEFSPWKALEKLMGGPKDLTVQDILRERKQAQEFDGGGGGGGGGNGGAGNRPGGWGGNGFDDSEDEGIIEFLDEFVQVMLATLSLLSLYIYIIQGQELTLLGRDYIKYLSGGEKSARLTQAMLVWARLKRQLMTREPKIEREDWLEHEIINTPTWWHSPSRVKRLLAKAIAASEITDDSNAAVANTPTWQHKPSQVKRMHSEATEDSDMPEDLDDLDMRYVPNVNNDSDDKQLHDFLQSLKEMDRHLKKEGGSEREISEATIGEQPTADSDESDDSSVTAS